MDKWIKPSERLPKDGERVLFIEVGSRRIQSGYFSKAWSECPHGECPAQFVDDSDSSWSVFADECIAWMPQPKLPDWALEYFESEYDAN